MYQLYNLYNSMLAEIELLDVSMRIEYDFSESRKNPYTKQLKRQITIRLDSSAVDYFQRLATELGIPYQNLIKLYLRECAAQKSRPVFLTNPPQLPKQVVQRKK